MPEEKKKRRLLAQLKAKKRSCTLPEAEAVLVAWQFTKGRSQGHSQGWNYRHITLTLHKPHGKHMDAGAVATVIRQIEAADLIQQEAARKRQEESPHVN